MLCYVFYRNLKDKSQIKNLTKCLQNVQARVQPQVLLQRQLQVEVPRQVLQIHRVLGQTHLPTQTLLKVHR